MRLDSFMAHLCENNSPKEVPELSTINAASPVDQNAGSGQVRIRRYDPDRKQGIARTRLRNSASAPI
jgi:hypothetical protein